MFSVVQELILQFLQLKKKKLINILFFYMFSKKRFLSILLKSYGKNICKFCEVFTNKTKNFNISKLERNIC